MLFRSVSQSRYGFVGVLVAVEVGVLVGVDVGVLVGVVQSLSTVHELG